MARFLILCCLEGFFVPMLFRNILPKVKGNIIKYLILWLISIIINLFIGMVFLELYMSELFFVCILLIFEDLIYRCLKERRQNE